MLMFIARRLGLMLLTALALTFIVFFLTNLAPNLEKLGEDRAALIEQLQAERTAAAYIAEHGEPVAHGGTALEQGEALFRR